VQFCTDGDRSRPCKEEDFPEFFEFYRDKQVRAEVGKICRYHELCFGYLEVVRHGDLPHLVWEKMARVVAGFNGRAMFKTYLSRSVLNLCLDQKRKAERAPEFVSLGERPEQPSPAALASLTRVEQRHLLQRAAELSLDESERKIFDLLLAGKETGEIARAFGVTPQTVRTWSEKIPRKMQLGLAEAMEQAQQKVKSATATATNVLPRANAADDRAKN
jgi:RNA polymerase sigma factor (sigma-70 family)